LKTSWHTDQHRKDKLAPISTLQVPETQNLF
jgi:hypothetical protein